MTLKLFALLAFLAAFLDLHETHACPYLAQQQQRNGDCEQQDTALKEDSPHDTRHLQRGRGGNNRGGGDGGRGRNRGRGGGNNNNNIDDSEDETTTTGTTTTSISNTISAILGNIFQRPSTPTTAVVPVTNNLSVNDAIAQARADIASMLQTNDDLAAKFVRLSFHDCVGGCDGCVDLSSTDNLGLNEPIDALDAIVTRYASTTALTRADIWVLAGLTAAEEAQTAGRNNNNGGGNVISFDMEYVGRAVCNDDDATGGPIRSFPSAHTTTQDLLNFFATTFDFSARDTVAIMGAHTLGKAESQNSGFDGDNGWVNNEERLDNQFYRVLLDDNGQVDNDFAQELQNNQNRATFPNQFLWRRNGRRGNNNFMLNIDMALAVDLEGYIDPVSGAVTCSLNGAGGTGTDVCPEASATLRMAREYANADATWRNDFRSAFLRMTNSGCVAGNIGACTAV